MTAEPLVELHGVSKVFRTEAEMVWAVRDVSLRSHAGEFVRIHGPSGSGKSTLLRLIVGLDLADTGEIRVAGRDVGTLDEDGRPSIDPAKPVLGARPPGERPALRRGGRARSAVAASPACRRRG